MVSVCRVLRLLLSCHFMIMLFPSFPLVVYTCAILFIYVRFYRCKCGRCNLQYLQNPKEFQCCAEIDKCGVPIPRNGYQRGGKQCNCVTLHPGFSQVCLQRWSLQLAADKYKTKNKTKYHQTGSENR